MKILIVIQRSIKLIACHQIHPTRYELDYRENSVCYYLLFVQYILIQFWPEHNLQSVLFPSLKDPTIGESINKLPE